MRDVSEGKKIFHVTKQDLYPYQQEGMMHLSQGYFNTEKDFESKLSSDFIQEKLIHQYGFHKKAAFLFNQLSLENEYPKQIKNLLLQCHEIYTQVNEIINGVVIN